MRKYVSLKKSGSAVLLFFSLMMFLTGISYGQQPETARQSLAILPFSATGLSSETIQTLESLLRQELAQSNHFTLIPEEQTYQATGEKTCSEIECAVEIGKKLSAQKVVLGNLSQLGSKIIFHYLLIDVASAQSVLSDNVSSMQLENMDVVMKRVASSIVTGQAINQTAKVDNIMEAETATPRRRAARKYWGINFGYLYPTEGYDDVDKSFTLDLRIGYEINQVTVGTHFAARKGFATNVYSSYLFTKTDICPYLGGAFGFHWVSHEDFLNYDNNKSGDGFEVTVNGGLRIFRTYNFQVLLNLDYIITFNDYNDKAVVFTIGLLR
jgi:TolB-like protein